MQGLFSVPEPLWQLSGVIISFYFDARYQAKGQTLQKTLNQNTALMQCGAFAISLNKHEKFGRLPLKYVID